MGCASYIFSCNSKEEKCRSKKVEFHHPLRESDEKLNLGKFVWSCLGLCFLRFFILLVGGNV
jgi:hypothetical protein